MGNGVKVVLVALLVIAVVVVAKVVQEDSTQPGKVPANALVTAKKNPESSGAVKLPGKTDQRLAAQRPAKQRSGGIPGQASRKTARNLKFTNKSRNPAVSSSRTAKRKTAETKPGASPRRTARANKPSTTRQGSANATIPSPAGSYNPPIRSKRENILEARVGPLASNTEGFRPLAPPPSSAQKSVAATPAQSPATPLIKQKPGAGKTLPVSSRVTKRPSGKVLVKADEQKKTRKAVRTAHKPKAVKYVVKRGDSYWGIAKKHYGSGGLHERIKKANAGKKLHPGMKITIPEKAAKKSESTTATNTRASLVSRNVSKSASPTTTKKKKAPARGAASPHGLKESSDGRYLYYVVEKGDTLSDLAARFKTGGMDRIKEANRSLFYTDLQTGQKIRIPKS